MILRIRNKINQHEIYVDTDNNNLKQFVALDEIQDETALIGIKLGIDFDGNLKINYICDQNIIEITEMDCIILYYTDASEISDKGENPNKLLQHMSVYKIVNGKTKATDSSCEEELDGLTINEFIDVVNNTSFAYSFASYKEEEQNLCMQ